MVKFNIPASPQLFQNQISNFLGVDFTTNELEMNPRRSPNALNLVNENGYTRKRNGYKTILNVDKKRINGIYNFDTSTENIILIHAGTSLYKYDSNFQNKIELLTNLNDIKSTGIFLNGMLCIFDGKRVVIYGKFDGQYKVKYADEEAYIPLTSINRNPDGSGAVAYEAYNLLGEKRKNGFITDGTSTEFKLDTDALNSADGVEVKKLNTLGEWITVNDYTVNHARASINFTSPPEKSPVTGRDNIEVTFTVRNQENKDLINRCKIITAFGYGGNSNRLFITNNGLEGHRNEEYISEANNPLYYPDSNTTKIGLDSAPITGYSRLSDGKLAIHKDITDTDCTIYYRNYNMYDGEEVFPLMSGTKGVGCINPQSCHTLQNDPLFLSRTGIYSVQSNGNNTDERYFNLRSYYINKKLLENPNLNEATAITYKNKYYISINNECYVCDSRMQSYEKNSNTAGYQYEWYYWDNINARVFFVYENELYFGDINGNINKFMKDYYKDNQNPIISRWETPFTNLNNPLNKKTIQRLTVSINPDKTDTGIIIGYITDKKDKKILNKLYANNQKTIPKQLICSKKIKKFMFLKLIIESSEATNIAFSEINIYFNVVGKHRGD